MGPVSSTGDAGWYQKILFSTGSLPSPAHQPTVTTPGDDPDRILLVGNGPAYGWGVTSHELSLTGQLARETHRGTGRPASVHFIGHEMMNVASAVTWLGDHDLSVYDAIVVMIGLNDAARLTPEDAWRRHMTGPLDRVWFAVNTAVLPKSVPAEERCADLRVRVGRKGDLDGDGEVVLAGEFPALSRVFLDGRQQVRVDAELGYTLDGAPIVAVSSARDRISGSVSSWGLSWCGVDR